MLDKILSAYPAVYAVGREYQIISVVTRETTCWVDVGGEEFFDESNGILRSGSPVHKVSVPAELLNEAKKYTVCLRPIAERKPYYTETGDVIRLTFDFKPVSQLVENNTLKDRVVLKNELCVIK